MRQRLIPLLAVALSATALTACGTKTDVVTHGETEAIFVDVGPEGGPYLKYQVQISRQLTPGDFENVAAKSDPEKVDPEDSEYLRGLTPQEAALKKNPQARIDDEVFFGVWIAAYNDTKKPLLSAKPDGFEIVDTQGERFEPFVAQDPRNPPNPFLYKQAMVPAHVGSGSGVLPPPNSPAGSSTTQGELLLFKIPQSSLENRPLVLHIKGPNGGEAEIDLDV
ncbi:hypothetical protein [Patulibacter defluvii]|uniref:hypothetical protein n=1 Tax=Patulibacter defluvii TaxID=3095358 RepID=UPI002A763CD4|nr:hypothetical protein [Patulibacter sp. DM4]